MPRSENERRLGRALQARAQSGKRPRSSRPPCPRSSFIGSRGFQSVRSLLGFDLPTRLVATRRPEASVLLLGSDLPTRLVATRRPEASVLSLGPTSVRAWLQPGDPKRHRLWSPLAVSAFACHRLPPSDHSSNIYRVPPRQHGHLPSLPIRRGQGQRWTGWPGYVMNAVSPWGHLETTQHRLAGQLACRRPGRCPPLEGLTSDNG